MYGSTIILTHNKSTLLGSSSDANVIFTKCVFISSPFTFLLILLASTMGKQHSASVVKSSSGTSGSTYITPTVCILLTGTKTVYASRWGDDTRLFAAV